MCGASQCESHVECVLLTVLGTGPRLCEGWRIGPVWADNAAQHVKEDNVIFFFFLLRKRACNTICGLNGARQRLRGSSCITTATVLKETTVGVCPCSVSSCRFVQVMNDIPAPCDPNCPCYQLISGALVMQPDSLVLRFWPVTDGIPSNNTSYVEVKLRKLNLAELV